jgi:polar amino acid transport system substrate-binding protein
VLIAKKEMVNVSKELNGKVVGVKAGATSERLANDLKNKHVNIVVKSYRESAEYLQDLESGRIDIALNDLLNQLEYNKAHKGLVVVGERLTSDTLGIAVRKENGNLLKIIDNVLVEMKENGGSKHLYN